MNQKTGGPLEGPVRVWRVLPRLILAALALSVAFVPSVQAAPCHVPGDYSSIQDAVNDETCATINVAAGTYHENVTIGRNLTLRGNGQESTIIIGGTDMGTVFSINSGTVTIKGVTITNGGGTSVGGGITNSGTLSVRNSTFSGNSSSNVGGGIFNSGTLSVENSTFLGNSADQNQGGGIANFNGGTLSVRNSTFSENFAAQDGGGIFNFNGGTLSVRNSTFSENTAGSGGGINNEGTMTLTRVTFVDNIPDDCVGSGCP